MSDAIPPRPLYYRGPQTLSAADARLFDACRHGDVDQAIGWLAAGASPFARDRYGHGPLHAWVWHSDPAPAARANDLPRLWQALSDQAEGLSLNERDAQDHTALALAVHPLRQPLVGALLALGANPNVRSAGSTFPLHQAVDELQAWAVRLLLDHQAEPDGFDDDGRTPLHRAVDHDDLHHDPDDGAVLEVVNLLLDAGANPGLTTGPARPRDMPARATGPEPEPFVPVAPLALAMRRNAPGVVATLLRAGALGAMSPLARRVLVDDAIEHGRWPALDALLASTVLDGTPLPVVQRWLEEVPSRSSVASRLERWILEGHVPMPDTLEGSLPLAPSRPRL